MTEVAMLEPTIVSQFESARRAAVEAAIWIPGDASDELKRARSSPSQFRFLLDEITKSAKELAIKQSATTDDFEWSMLPEAVDIVSYIQSALVNIDWAKPDLDDLRKSWNFWRHEKDPFHRIQRKTTPFIDRASLEEGATRYLKSPFRAQAVDRTLVDSLTAVEMYAFGDEMWNEPIFSGARIISPLRRPHVVWQYIRGQLGNAVLFGTIAALAFALYGLGIISGTATAWTMGIAVALFIFFLIIATVFLPSAWWTQHTDRRRVVDVMEQLVHAYSQLRSDGAISAYHMRNTIQRAADRGIVWPAPLFALLDDIITRSGRF